MGWRIDDAFSGEGRTIRRNGLDVDQDIVKTVTDDFSRVHQLTAAKSDDPVVGFQLFGKAIDFGKLAAAIKDFDWIPKKAVTPSEESRPSRRPGYGKHFCWGSTPDYLSPD